MEASSSSTNDASRPVVDDEAQKRRRELEQTTRAYIEGASAHAWYLLFHIVAMVLSRTRHADWAHQREGEDAPRWFCALSNAWNARFRKHWLHWRWVLFAVLIAVVVQYWVVPAIDETITHATSHAMAIGLYGVRGVSALPPAEVPIFFERYKRYIPFSARVGINDGADGLIARFRTMIDTMQARRRERPDMADSDENGIDDDIELAQWSNLLDTLEKDYAVQLQHQTNGGVPIALRAPPRMTAPLEKVCSYVTQYDTASHDFYPRRTCFDVLKLIADMRYSPNSILVQMGKNAIEAKKNAASDPLVGMPQFQKARDDALGLNLDQNMTSWVHKLTQSDAVLQGRIPCVCMAQLGIAEPGAYFADPDGTTRLVLAPQLHPLTPEEKARNRGRMDIAEVKFAHYEIETTDGLLWDKVRESPKLEQPYEIKFDYWTLPSDDAMNAYYTRTLGTTHVAFLRARAGIEQAMRNYEENAASNSARDDGPGAAIYRAIAEMNRAAHNQVRRDALLDGLAFEALIQQRSNATLIEELRKQLRRQLERIADDASRAKGPAGAASDNWWDGAVKFFQRQAGMPEWTGLRSKPDVPVDVTTPPSAATPPTLVRVVGAVEHAPQSRCIFHCKHLHDMLEQRRSEDFAEAWRQWVEAERASGAIVVPHAGREPQRAAERDAVKGADDYRDQFT